MDLNEIKRLIKPCDMDKPFAFVSYSSKDNYLVWQDVLELQRRGYNIWLDEANLTKTKSSWRDDAIKAIKDLECRLLIFYLSKNSFISQNCYQEVMTCDCEEVRDLRQGEALPYIVVDVEPISDITQFNKTCYSDIRENTQLDKNVRTQRILTMNSFMKNVFNSSNDRIRVHSRLESGRTVEDYYEKDIIDSLTRNEVTADPSVRKAAPAPASAAELKSEQRPTAPGTAAGKKSAAKQQAAPSPAKADPAPSAPISKNSAAGYPLYYSRGDNRAGFLKQTGEKEFLLLSGAEMRLDNTPTCPDQYLKLRSKLISGGQAKDSGEGHYILTADIPVTSMSLGAGVLVGRSVNGKEFWNPCEAPILPSSVNAATTPDAADDESEAQNDAQYPIYYQNTNPAFGTVKQTGSKEYILMPGARFSPDVAPSCPEGYHRLREKIITESAAKDQSGEYVLEQEVSFSSLSAAACVIAGRSLNGKLFWLTVESPFDPLDRTIGEVRKMFEQENFCSQVALLRKTGLPWGGRGALDYAMAAILGGCNNVKSPAQINYYCFAIADMSKKKDAASLGATWTWSSNCRKLLGEPGSGKINPQADAYFAALPENTSLRQILNGFEQNREFFQTQKNSLVIECLKMFLALL